MNIEQQCISLDHAKRLKELGVKQDSYFHWCKTQPILTSSGTDNAPAWKDLHLLTIHEQKRFDYIEKFSAFTVTELLELLPHRIITKQNEPFNTFTLQIRKGYIIKDQKELINLHATGIYRINYICETAGDETNWEFHPLMNNIIDESFDNALAKMVIFLIENDLLNTMELIHAND